MSIPKFCVIRKRRDTFKLVKRFVSLERIFLWKETKKMKLLLILSNKILNRTN